MFFTAAEKTISFGDWKMRFVAFDCSRRYLYYSEFIDCEPTLEYNIRSDNYYGQKNKWKRKIKVTEVRALTTENRVPVNTIGFRPVDLLQLEFIGEERPIAPGEIPPAGPLLHPTSDLSPYDKKLYAIGNENFIKDPFGLIDLYNGLRDLFTTISQDRHTVIAAAAEAGRTIEEPPFATICSPRGKKGDHVSGKKASVILRCRNEREFRRLWYVVQTTLGYDKLCLRPYRGLPPYDPRNGVTFSHIPMTMWHEFKALDSAVFYNFTCGDVVGPISPNSFEVKTLLHSVCMFITHDMVYFMRNSGSIPRWIRLQEVRTVQYNITAREPFIAFRCDRPAPDTVFMPRRSEETFDSRDMLIGLDFKPELQVVRARHVLHDSCLASLAVRRVFTVDETFDHSVQAYADRLRKAGTPLCLIPDSSFESAMSCPLPKEQLAAVWYKVQEQLRSTGRLPNSAAIPLYGSNASEIQLNEEQLALVARRLREQRSSSSDIVGMSLEEAQRVAHRMESSPSSPRSTTSREENAQAVESLRTPQIGFEEAQRRMQGARLVEEEKRAERAAREAVPSYVDPDARYITEEEVRSGTFAEVPREHHVEVTNYSFATSGMEQNVSDLLERSKLAFSKDKHGKHTKHK